MISRSKCHALDHDELLYTRLGNTRVMPQVLAVMAFQAISNCQIPIYYHHSSYKHVIGVTLKVEHIRQIKDSMRTFSQ